MFLLFSADVFFISWSLNFIASHSKLNKTNFTLHHNHTRCNLDTMIVWVWFYFLWLHKVTLYNLLFWSRGGEVKKKTEKDGISSLIDDFFCCDKTERRWALEPKPEEIYKSKINRHILHPVGKIAKKNSKYSAIIVKNSSPADCFFGDFAHWVKTWRKQR